MRSERLQNTAECSEKTKTQREYGDILQARWGKQVRRGSMDYYKWYKGDELPTEECDCVVVYRTGQWGYQPKAELSKVRVNPYNCLQEREFLFVRNNHSSIPAGAIDIIRWMPIEFPEEVE